MEAWLFSAEEFCNSDTVAFHTANRNARTLLFKYIPQEKKKPVVVS